MFPATICHGERSQPHLCRKATVTAFPDSRVAVNIRANDCELRKTFGCVTPHFFPSFLRALFSVEFLCQMSRIFTRNRTTLDESMRTCILFLFFEADRGKSTSRGDEGARGAWKGWFSHRNTPGLCDLEFRNEIEGS